MRDALTHTQSHLIEENANEALPAEMSSCPSAAGFFLLRQAGGQIVSLLC